MRTSWHVLCGLKWVHGLQFKKAQDNFTSVQQLYQRTKLNIYGNETNTGLFVMKCCVLMHYSLPHNPCCCSLPSPMCILHLLICPYLNSSLTACPASYESSWVALVIFIYCNFWEFVSLYYSVLLLLICRATIPSLFIRFVLIFQ